MIQVLRFLFSGKAAIGLLCLMAIALILSIPGQHSPAVIKPLLLEKGLASLPFLVLLGLLIFNQFGAALVRLSWFFHKPESVEPPTEIKTSSLEMELQSEEIQEQAPIPPAQPPAELAEYRGKVETILPVENAYSMIGTLGFSVTDTSQFLDNKQEIEAKKGSSRSFYTCVLHLGAAVVLTGLFFTFFMYPTQQVKLLEERSGLLGGMERTPWQETLKKIGLASQESYDYPKVPITLKKVQSFFTEVRVLQHPKGHIARWENEFSKLFLKPGSLSIYSWSLPGIFHTTSQIHVGASATPLELSQKKSASYGPYLLTFSSPYTEASVLLAGKTVLLQQSVPFTVSPGHVLELLGSMSSNPKHTKGCLLLRYTAAKKTPWTACVPNEARSQLPGNLEIQVNQVSQGIVLNYSSRLGTNLIGIGLLLFLIGFVGFWWIQRYKLFLVWSRDKNDIHIQASGYGIKAKSMLQGIKKTLYFPIENITGPSRSKTQSVSGGGVPTSRPGGGTSLPPTKPSGISGTASQPDLSASHPSTSSVAGLARLEQPQNVPGMVPLSKDAEKSVDIQGIQKQPKIPAAPPVPDKPTTLPPTPTQAPKTAVGPDLQAPSASVAKPSPQQATPPAQQATTTAPRVQPQIPTTPPQNVAQKVPQKEEPISHGNLPKTAVPSSSGQQQTVTAESSSLAEKTSAVESTPAKVTVPSTAASDPSEEVAQITIQTQSRWRQTDSFDKEAILNAAKQRPKGLAVLETPSASTNQTNSQPTINRVKPESLLEPVAPPKQATPERPQVEQPQPAHGKSAALPTTGTKPHSPVGTPAASPFQTVPTQATSDLRSIPGANTTSATSAPATQIPLPKSASTQTPALTPAQETAPPAKVSPTFSPSPLTSPQKLPGTPQASGVDSIARAPQSTHSTQPLQPEKKSVTLPSTPSIRPTTPPPPVEPQKAMPPAQPPTPVNKVSPVTDTKATGTGSAKTSNDSGLNLDSLFAGLAGGGEKSSTKSDNLLGDLDIDSLFAKVEDNSSEKTAVSARPRLDFGDDAKTNVTVARPDFQKK